MLPDARTARSLTSTWQTSTPTADDPIEALRARLAERTETGPWLPPIGGAASAATATGAVSAMRPSVDDAGPADAIASSGPTGTAAGGSAASSAATAASPLPAATVSGTDTSPDLDAVATTGAVDPSGAAGEAGGPPAWGDGAGTGPSPATSPPDTSLLDTAPPGSEHGGAGGPDVFGFGSDPAVIAPLGDDATATGPDEVAVDAGPDRRRTLKVLGALVAVAVGFAAVVWFVGGDGDGPDEVAVDATAVDAAPGTAAPPTAITTPVSTAPADTTPPATEPAPTTAPETSAPETTVPETVPPTVSTIAFTLPPDGVAYTDPAGWTLLTDPTWTSQPSDGSTAWLTGVSSPAFADRVDVTVEQVDPGLTLDRYVAAMWQQVVTGFPDATLVDQIRAVGDDGVQREVLTWTGSVPGGPPRAFVQAIAVEGTLAVTATLTTEPDRVRPQALLVGPFLASIRPV